MKSKILIIVVLLCGLFSCTTDKRLYTTGYNIQWNKKHAEQSFVNKTELTNDLSASTNDNTVIVKHENFILNKIDSQEDGILIGQNEQAPFKGDTTTTPDNITIPPGKALIYIIRPNPMTGITSFNVYCDKKFIGKTSIATYLYTIQDPGKHLFESNTFQNDSYIELDVEAGKVYYLEQTAGMLFRIKQLDEEKGKKKLNKCSLAQNRVQEPTDNIIENKPAPSPNTQDPKPANNKWILPVLFLLLGFSILGAIFLSNS